MHQTNCVVVGARDLEEDLAAVGPGHRAAGTASAAAVTSDQWTELAARLVFTRAANRGTEMNLQGTRTATKSKCDGIAADVLVGHRLSFTGNRVEIDGVATRAARP